MKKQNEARQQQECWIWFNNEYCTKSKSPRLIIHSIVNGFSVSIPSSIPKVFHQIIYKMIGAAVNKFKLTGMTCGISDMMIHGVGGRCLWLEFKTDDGKLAVVQSEMEHRVNALGGRYFVVRGLEHFKEIALQN